MRRTIKREIHATTVTHLGLTLTLTPTENLGISDNRDTSNDGSQCQTYSSTVRQEGGVSGVFVGRRVEVSSDRIHVLRSS